MSEGAKAFNRLSDDFSRSEAADKLSKLGYSTKEFNEVLALSVTGKRFDAANDQQSSLKARQAAEELAVEMDKVAQLTGVSRRDQMEALQAQQRPAQRLGACAGNGCFAYTGIAFEQEGTLQGQAHPNQARQLFVGDIARMKQPLAQALGCGGVRRVAHRR